MLASGSKATRVVLTDNPGFLLLALVITLGTALTGKVFMATNIPKDFDVQTRINAQVATLVANAATGYRIDAADILQMVMNAVLMGAIMYGERAACEKLADIESRRDEPEPCLVRIPLDRLDATDGGLRSGDWTQDDSFRELVKSIETMGQKDPITVCAMGNTEVGPIVYQVIRGFRRYAALRYLAQTRGIHPSTVSVLAVVVSENDAECLAMQIQQTQPEPLRDPDLCAAVTNLAEIAPGHSNAQLAAWIGMSEAETTWLLRIGRNAPPALIKHWRNDDNPLPIAEVFRVVTKHKTPEAQLAAYQKKCEVRRGTRDL